MSDYSANRRIPAHVFSMHAAHDFDALASFSLDLRRENRSNAILQPTIDSSGVDSQRLAQLAHERDDPHFLFGEADCFPLGGYQLDVWRDLDLGPAFREPVQSTVPLLLLSGTLDARTPISNAEAVQRGFVNSQHVIVDGGGHQNDFWYRHDPERAMAIVTAFLHDEPIPSDPIRVADDFEVPAI